MLDDAQAVVASYGYDPYGRLISETPAPGDPSYFDQPFRFSTKRHYADLGLNYYGYRFYSPSLGRWINRDPLGENGGLNLYGYGWNNPVMFADTDGLVPAPVIGAAVGFIIGGATAYFTDPRDPDGSVNWGGVFRSAGVGAIAGGLSTISIGSKAIKALTSSKGAQAVLKAAVNSAISGLVSFTSNYANQRLSGTSYENIDWNSAFLSGGAGALGGFSGGEAANFTRKFPANYGLIKYDRVSQLESEGGRVLSSIIGGISGGTIDAFWHSYYVNSFTFDFSFFTYDYWHGEYYGLSFIPFNFY